MAIDGPICSGHLSSLVCTGKSLAGEKLGAVSKLARGLPESQALGASSKSRKEESQHTADNTVWESGRKGPNRAGPGAEQVRDTGCNPEAGAQVHARDPE